jgi:transcriptional regulator GlxA family with amidase domain
MVIGAAKSVQSSCGVEVSVAIDITNCKSFDHVIVIGGKTASPLANRAAMIDCLRRADLEHATLAGVGSGMFLLIEAGLYDGHRCATDWYSLADYQLRFASVRQVSGEPFVVDRRRVSCGGGIAALELGSWLVMHHRRCTPAPPLRPATIDVSKPNSRSPAEGDVTSHDPRVRRALSLIERNLDAPLRAETIATSVGLSRRQLERLFLAQVGTGIQHYSRDLRTSYGLWLLLRTTRPITDVALECGFSDSSHFNRTFHAAFGVTPGDARRDQRPSLDDVSGRWLQLFQKISQEIEVPDVATIPVKAVRWQPAGMPLVRAAAGR